MATSGTSRFAKRKDFHTNRVRIRVLPPSGGSRHGLLTTQRALLANTRSGPGLEKLQTALWRGNIIFRGTCQPCERKPGGVERHLIVVIINPSLWRLRNLETCGEIYLQITTIIIRKLPHPANLQDSLPHKSYPQRPLSRCARPSTPPRRPRHPRHQ